MSAKWHTYECKVTYLANENSILANDKYAVYDEGCNISYSFL
jgi:hypothetical protein